MATDTTVRARIDERVKNEAAHVLEDMGLSVSDAIRMMLMRVASEKALPFAVKVPNAVTARYIVDSLTLNKIANVLFETPRLHRVTISPHGLSKSAQFELAVTLGG